LNNFGYYPVIVTRKYEEAISNFEDLSKPTPMGVSHEKNENYEVYYLPFKGNLKDKLLVKYGKNRFVFLRRFFSLSELIFQNIFISTIPFSNLYYFSKKLLVENDFKLIISSGRPYILFKFCYLLNKASKIPWIADYRDPWSTHPWFKNRGVLSLIDKYFEKKWVGSASAITSCSEQWSKDIGTFVKRPGYVVYNGYEAIGNSTEELNNLSDTFNIIHNGTLYEAQNTEIFINAFKKFINKSEAKKIKIFFYGVSIDNIQTQRIQNQFKGFEEYIDCTERLDHNIIVKSMKQASLLLIFGESHNKGWYPLKFFDYISVQKPILLCPSDNNVLEKLIMDTKTGFVMNNEEDVLVLLTDLYNKWENGQKIEFNVDNKFIEKYSRANQSKELSGIIDKVIAQNSLVQEKTSTFRSKAFHILNNSGYNRLIPASRLINEKVTVLCFHGVSPFKNFSYPPLHPQQFEMLIKFITQKFQITSFDEIKSLKRNKKPLAVITFDDGYKDFIEFALPILTRYHIPAVQSIVVESVQTGKPFWTQRLNNITNYLHEKKSDFSYTYKDESFLYTSNNFNSFYMKLFSFLLESYSDVKNYILTEIEDQFFNKNYYKIEMMSWKDIKQCVDNNISIGSHSMTHDTLSTINNDELLINEIVRSKEIITDIIQRPVTSFAFPNGYYNEQVLEIAKKNYDYLLCTNEKAVKKSFFNETPVMIPRISIDKKNYWENIAKINSFHNLIMLKT
jgi:peptidoglycan/xylan/chitin deacetylase (PgdA/CDA1 family)